MDRRFFLDLAAAGHRAPIGTHLVLHEHADHAALVLDGPRLGEMIVTAAQRFSTPLAIPLMDLTLEKAALLQACGVPINDVDSYHFTSVPEAPDTIALTPRMLAACEAIRHVRAAGQQMPMGMAIGPFSLMTKLVADPITPVFMAGLGTTAEEDNEIAIVEAALVAAEQVIATYVAAQLRAGAQAIILCEPAANQVYFSPKQLAEGYATFERYVMTSNARLARQITDGGAALVFHDCGELTDGMVERFGTLGAAMLSFGSSRKLWEDAARVPKDVVLYGNLPTKRFYASELTVSEVERQTRELMGRMHETGHPFILGSECDVLSVPGAEASILDKVQAFLRCGCEPTAQAAGFACRPTRSLPPT